MTIQTATEVTNLVKTTMNDVFVVCMHA